MKRLPMLTLIAAVALVWLCSPALSQGTNEVDPANQAEARRIWELAVQAKGGRERLQKVQNFQASLFLHSPGSNPRETPFASFLCVIPGKQWSFEDYGKKSVFGATATMQDFENRTTYFAQNGVSSVAKSMTAADGQSAAWMHAENAVYLVESKTQQADVRKVESHVVNGYKLYLVTTSIDGQRVDFDFDSVTYLPRRVVAYHERETGGVSVITHDLLQYRDVDGIKMPTWITDTYPPTPGRSESSIRTFYLEVQLNVAYDPAIFERSPDKLTSNSWRLRH